MAHTQTNKQTYNNEWIVCHLDKCTELHSDNDFYLIFYYKVVTAHINKQIQLQTQTHSQPQNTACKVMECVSVSNPFCLCIRSYLPFSFWRMTVQCPVVNPQNHRQHGIINKTVAVATRVLCRSFDFSLFLDYIPNASFTTLTLLLSVTPFFLFMIVLFLMILWNCLVAFSHPLKTYITREDTQKIGNNYLQCIVLHHNNLQDVHNILHWSDILNGLPDAILCDRKNNGILLSDSLPVC